MVLHQWVASGCPCCESLLAFGAHMAPLWWLFDDYLVSVGWAEWVCSMQSEPGRISFKTNTFLTFCGFGLLLGESVGETLVSLWQFWVCIWWSDLELVMAQCWVRWSHCMVQYFENKYWVLLFLSNDFVLWWASTLEHLRSKLWMSTSKCDLQLPQDGVIGALRLAWFRLNEWCSTCVSASI